MTLSGELNKAILVIVYDIYVRKLDRLMVSEKSSTNAFADDVMLATQSLDDFLQVHLEVISFGRVTGCLTHLKKCHFISNREDPVFLSWISHHSFWPARAARDSGTYLGILNGRGVTVRDIHRGALKKFEDRLTDFRPVFKVI